MALAQAGSSNDKHTTVRDNRRGSSAMFASFLRRGERASKVTCAASEIGAQSRVAQTQTATKGQLTAVTGPCCPRAHWWHPQDVLAKSMYNGRPPPRIRGCPGLGSGCSAVFMLLLLGRRAHEPRAWSGTAELSNSQPSFFSAFV
jgi:hypothetical protein